MCLLLLKPSSARLTRRQILNAYAWNNDGFGMSWTENGRVHAIQGMFDSFEILKLYEEHKTRNLAMHFRFSTSGELSTRNTHPFQVLNKEEDGFDLWVMHNGIMQGIQDIPEDRSDTFQFVEAYLKPILKNNPMLIHDKAFQHMLSRFLGMGNKLLFMLGDGKVYIINHFLGFKSKNGIWFSNKYSLIAPKAPHQRSNRIGGDIKASELDQVKYDPRYYMWMIKRPDGSSQYFPKWLLEQKLSDMESTG
jgi:hypothetical protein